MSLFLSWSVLQVTDWLYVDTSNEVGAMGSCEHEHSGLWLDIDDDEVEPWVAVSMSISSYKITVARGT